MATSVEPLLTMENVPLDKDAIVRFASLLTTLVNEYRSDNNCVWDYHRSKELCDIAIKMLGLTRAGADKLKQSLEGGICRHVSRGDLIPLSYPIYTSVGRHIALPTEPNTIYEINLCIAMMVPYLLLIDTVEVFDDLVTMNPHFTSGISAIVAKYEHHLLSQSEALSTDIVNNTLMLENG